MKNMKTSNERPFEGGTLVVTDVPAQKCECDELILVGDGALIAGYANHLRNANVIGRVQVSLDDLKRKFTVQDFLPKNACNT
jgi:hypothetical protein